MTGEVVGFVAENGNFRSARDDVRSIIDEFEVSMSENESGSPVSYVNQWRIRTSGNVTANVEFFFNAGSLPGDELMFQLFHVMSRMNSVNVHVLLLCMDAGGNNSRLATLLRHEKKLNDCAWLDDNLISFVDPTSDCKYRTAVSHCSTHNLKAFRNAFFNSGDSPKKSRHFSNNSKDY